MSDFSREEMEGLLEAANLLVRRKNLIRKKLAIATDPNEIFKYEENIKELESQLEDIKKRLADLGYDRKKGKQANQKKRLEDHHQYTCNRNRQDEDFLNYIYPSDIDTEKLLPNFKRHKKLNFFFIYGGTKQEQFGLYQRFCNTLAGRDRDFLPSYQPSAIVVEDVKKFHYPKYVEENSLKKGILREFFKSLAIEDHEMEPILDKNLAFAIENSPRLFDLSEKEKIAET